MHTQLESLTKTGNVHDILQPSTRSRSIEVQKGSAFQKSTTVSDIGSYLKHKFEESPKLSRREAPSTENTRNVSSIFDTKKEDTMLSTPQTERKFGVERSRSFSKFKNAFEDGVGLMNDNDENSLDKMRVNTELNALKSFSKIQKMFRISRSQS